MIISALYVTLMMYNEHLSLTEVRRRCEESLKRSLERRTALEQRTAQRPRPVLFYACVGLTLLAFAAAVVLLFQDDVWVFGFWSSVLVAFSAAVAAGKYA